jgi:hypothetical protein
MTTLPLTGHHPGMVTRAGLSDLPVSVAVIMCATCGGPLSRQGKIYCSWQCSNGRAGTRAGSRTAKPCEICGQQFKAKGSGRTTGYVQRTCSRACGVELRRREGTLSRPYVLGSTGPASRVYIRECAWCSKLFVGRAVNHWTCSKDCSRKQGWANDVRRIHKKERRCGCGQQIPLKRQKCDDCRDASDREAKRRWRRTRKARQRGVITEPYTIAEIAARDRYRCGFCRKRVAMTKAVPHPKAPTIDHIVPLAEGGDDTRANVQLAHFLCNSLAGVTGTKQAALFG